MLYELKNISTTPEKQRTDKDESKYKGPSNCLSDIMMDESRPTIISKDLKVKTSVFSHEDIEIYCSLCFAPDTSSQCKFSPITPTRADWSYLWAIITLTSSVDFLSEISTARTIFVVRNKYLHRGSILRHSFAFLMN